MERLYASATFAAFALLNACASPGSDVPESFLGSPGMANAATQTIVIRPDTPWVNVKGGDTVNFVAGAKEFAWTFNGAPAVSSFNLNRIAPAGMLDHEIKVYVAPDPRYSGR